MDKNIAISVKNVSKTFKIPHEKVSSLRGAAVSLFSRNKGYEEFKALDDVSFEVKKGEFFGIIGRNGSGKSTLLKILAGIYQPDKGKVNIDGRISPFLELGIGFNPELSGRDNVYLNATVLGLTKKEIDEKFDSIVKFSELERFIDQKLKNYSSGMQVRLAFSVSIHANREILLMDEVLAVGDNNFQSKCLTEFAKYKEMGKTVILVSHDITTVQRYCDRALLLRSGKIVKIGSAENVGNEYMYENMVDEENVINHQKKEDSIKKDRIVNVCFLNNRGVEKNVFNTGDDIVIRIKYNATREILNPIFGVAIHREDDLHITGPNTETSNFNIDSIFGEGHVDFEIIKNPLFSGLYKVSVSFYEQGNTIIPFDFRDKDFKFKIISNEKNQFGIVKLDHRWKLKQSNTTI